MFVRPWFFIPAAFAIVLGTGSIANARLDSIDVLAQWGNNELRTADPPASMKPEASTANDFFGVSGYSSAHHAKSLAASGTYLLTAGSGSQWIYDPVHKIAAVAEHGDVSGGFLLHVSEAPPHAIFSRDLSRVESARGLRLGLSAAQVEHILGLPPTAAQAAKNGATAIYTRNTFVCGPGSLQCAHDETFIFKDDKAVAIGLADVGP